MKVLNQVQPLCCQNLKNKKEQNKTQNPQTQFKTAPHFTSANYSQSIAAIGQARINIDKSEKTSFKDIDYKKTDRAIELSILEDKQIREELNSNKPSLLKDIAKDPELSKAFIKHVLHDIQKEINTIEKNGDNKTNDEKERLLLLRKSKAYILQPMQDYNDKYKKDKKSNSGEKKSDISFKGWFDDAKEAYGVYKWTRRAVSVAAIIGTGGLAAPLVFANELAHTVVEEGVQAVVEEGISHLTEQAAERVVDTAVDTATDNIDNVDLSDVSGAHDIAFSGWTIDNDTAKKVEDTFKYGDSLKRNLGINGLSATFTSGIEIAQKRQENNGKIEFGDVFKILVRNAIITGVTSGAQTYYDSSTYDQIEANKKIIAQLHHGQYVYHAFDGSDNLGTAIRGFEAYNDNDNFKSSVVGAIATGVATGVFAIKTPTHTVSEAVENAKQIKETKSYIVDNLRGNNKEIVQDLYKELDAAAEKKDWAKVDKIKEKLTKYLSDLSNT